jgi:hypothetical protein
MIKRWALFATNEIRAQDLSIEDKGTNRWATMQIFENSMDDIYLNVPSSWHLGLQ